MKKIIFCGLIGFAIIFFYSENVTAYDSYGDLFVYVSSNSTVIAKGRDGYHELKYTLTPLGWSYYKYLKGGYYNIYVNGAYRKRVHVPGNFYAEVNL